MSQADEYEQLMAQAASQMEAVRDMSAQMADLRGEGEAADGKVRVTVVQGGYVDSVELDPRAMKLASEDLAAAVVEAAHAATDDATTKMGQLLDSALPGAGESIASLTDPEEVIKGKAASEEKVNSIIEALRQGYDGVSRPS